jgi:hypothetical protein
MTDEPHVEAEDRGGGEWDAPNQQVVRADQSAPWDEGTGGTPDEATPVATVETTSSSTVDLDAMTKAELLDHARELGVSPANNDMTKEELRTAIDDHQAGGG